MDCSKKACKELIVMKKSLVWFASLSFSVLQIMNVNAYALSEGPSSAQPASQPSAVQPASQPTAVQPATQPSAVQPATQPSAVQPAVQPSPQEEAPISGKVIETMSSGGYTYALLEKDGKKIWIAAPATNVTVGQEVSFLPGVNMGAFESKTLKRKFDDIIFSAGLVGQVSMGNSAAAAQPAEQIKVEKAQGPNAYTINELINNSDKLDKHAVVVKGKVIKVSEAIMGKNWVHIKDGSGPEREKLVVTSKDLPKVGDVITVNGTLYKDKDFGSGYKYAVIIEEATIK